MDKWDGKEGRVIFTKALNETAQKDPVNPILMISPEVGMRIESKFMICWI